MSYKHIQDLYLGESKAVGPPIVGHVGKHPRDSLEGPKEPRLEEQTIHLGQRGEGSRYYLYANLGLKHVAILVDSGTDDNYVPMEWV